VAESSFLQFLSRVDQPTGKLFHNLFSPNGLPDGPFKAALVLSIPLRWKTEKLKMGYYRNR
jgi:hypothetical protein